MLLSSNISPHIRIADFVNQALEQVSAIFCIGKYDDGSIRIHTDKGALNAYNEADVSHFLQTSNTGWYIIQETPFSKKQHIGQTTLEMELDKDHLLLRNIQTMGCTLFLLVQVRPFGPKKGKYLLAAEKKQFERSIRGFVDAFLAINQQDKLIIHNIAKSNVSLGKELTNAKQALTSQSRQYEGAIQQFIQLIINKLQDKFGIRIHIGKTFTEELKDYKLPYDQLEQNLEKHIEIELNLALTAGKKEITLTPIHLTGFEPFNPIETPEQSNIQLGRYAKTYKLLERYEQAAKQAQEKGLSVIGKHIGNECIPPVSNASITDALNKQAKKIYDLFEKYPNKWSTIRNYFRSVANVIEKESIRRREIA